MSTDISARDARNRRRNERRRQHKEQGLCIHCNEKAEVGRVMCKRHAELHYLWQRRNPIGYARMLVRTSVLRQRYADENRCPRCSAPLDPDADMNRVCCVNCRGGFYGIN